MIIVHWLCLCIHCMHAWIYILYPSFAVDSQWLEDCFLGYLKSWENSVQQRQGFTKAQRELMLLSRETREGLQITG